MGHLPLVVHLGHDDVLHRVDEGPQFVFWQRIKDPRVLNPLPEKELGAFIDSVEHVIVPEVNYQGQMAHHLAATFGFRPIPLNKYGGLPFTPGEIFRKIEEVLGRGH